MKTRSRLHPEKWMSVERQGLKCLPANAFIDPIRPVEAAIITHGHADHARPGHKRVYATRQTHDIMRIRYGERYCQEVVLLEYQQEIAIAQDVTLRLLPAGHILGSAQAVLEHRGGKLIISGDYKRSYDPTCPAFLPESCDVFVTEATFALPVFKHPIINDEIQKLLTSLALNPQRCHLVGVYALGKCQRVLMALRELGYDKPVYLHGALIKLCEYYESQGIDLGAWVPVSEVKDKNELAGEIVLAPPSALADRWSRKLPEVMTVMASGWMQIRARSKQRRAELPLIISDHCDWQELIDTANDVKAPEIWITHGREEALAHQLVKLGFVAKPLSLLGYEEEEQEEQGAIHEDKEPKTPDNASIEAV